MRYFLFSVLFTVVSANFVLAEKVSDQFKDPKELIKKMVEKTGDYNKLKSLKDVQYTYTQRDNPSGREDVSIERYIFDGELSWAKYLIHQNHVFADKQGEVIQGYNGKESWVTLDGQLLDDPQANKLADFLRKTNFYWFAMIQKLLDPGLNYSYEGNKSINNINYDIVNVSFDTGVGDVSDTYVLYINPETNLVDQFLFTVMDFNVSEPYIMKVEYEQIDGVVLPAKRRLTKSNWDGDILEDNWTEEIMTDIKFNNSFKREDFDKPRK
jgi:hypothetical protein